MEHTYLNTSGIILTVQDNILITTGLMHCFTGEVVNIYNHDNVQVDCLGVILTLDFSIVRIVILKGSQRDIYAGYKVSRTYEYVKTRAGFGILGCSLTTLGSILVYSNTSTDRSIICNELSSIELIDIGNVSPTIIQRETIATPFLTGVAAVDCFIPIGCGQRELIIGDFNTGKTSLALTVVLNQAYVINIVDSV